MGGRARRLCGLQEPHQTVAAGFMRRVVIVGDPFVLCPSFFGLIPLERGGQRENDGFKLFPSCPPEGGF
jgi:hypothetical protein